MSPLIGALDQGTTSTRFVLFNETGEIVTYHQIEFEQHYPHPGWVEHDPFELLDSCQVCIETAVANLNKMDGYQASDIKGIGITNQRETTIVWDNQTGRPLYNAIVWSDGRTQHTVDQLAKQGGGKDVVRDICGLPLTTYFSAVKLRWLLDHVPSVAQAKDDHRLVFSTVDSWLIFHLTGGLEDHGVLVTDVTNASRTMLMDIHTLKWSDEAIRFFGFEGIKLAEIKSSSSIYGKIKKGALAGLPIAGCLGDQQAALVGQKCFKKGMAKNTYGTGCFMLFNVGTTPVTSSNGLLTTVAYQLGDKDDSVVYALEGSVAVAGSSVSWLRNNLNLIADTNELNDLAGSVENTGGVYFVTAFGGLFAPYWKDDARGTICGLTQYTNRAHLARATLEAACYQSKAVLEAMNKDSGTLLEALNVDGGMSNSDLCMQIQANLLGAGVQVTRPKMRETTALGSAIAAGLALGIWKNLDDISNKVNKDGETVFTAQIPQASTDRLYKGWQKAVTRSFGWTEPDDE
ncbi:glycerol kinase [Chlamydoabsidia padenii]|nr:glycerol kinase [Chlamydoabsidia padenii]